MGYLFFEFSNFGLIFENISLNIEVFIDLIILILVLESKLDLKF